MSEHTPSSHETHRVDDHEVSPYQDWANYPTWSAHLWITNDEGVYHAAHGVMAASGTVSQGASDLKEWAEEGNPLAETASMYADILSWALSCVDWDEVARALEPEEWDTQPRSGTPNQEKEVRVSERTGSLLVTS